MLKNINKKLSRISPQVIVIAALAAVIGSSGLALFFTRSASEADAGAVPRVARIERVDGDVDIARSFAPTDDSALDSALEWDDATLNAPLSAGDRIYARENSRATLALTGRNFARIDPGTTLDVLSFTDDRTQLALRSGSAIFDVGHLEPGELFEVATPHGAVDFYEPGLYQVGFGDDGSAMISVLSGLAEVVGLAGSGQISKGEMLTLLGTVAAQAALSRLAPDLAGGIVDDYYGYRYPDYYDGRYRDYDVYLDDPYYYQPYRRARSYRAVRYEDAYYDVPGWYDLDDHGDWVDYEGYGRCWSPRVDAGWSPYRNGSWVHDDLWGPTWVSNEPWGWAPYHYGRWACMNNGRWVWVPENVATYAPALVAFVPLRQTNQVGWVPLAPGEPYIPRTYDAYYRPRYYGAPDVVSRVVSVQRTYVNLSVPSAVTAVPVSAFTRGGASEFVTFANPQVIAQSQPVLDPFAIDGVREVLVRKKNGRYKVKQVPVYAQEAFNRPVVTSAAPLSLPGRPDLVQAFNAQVVPEKKRKNKIKWNDGGQVVVARRPDGLPQPPIPQPNASAIAQERGQRIAALRVQAAQGNQEARRELRELKRQQREEEKMARRAARQQVTWPQALPP
ncbi:MAG TPA: FecR family protein, partial [Blastocatellia bacterium]|nr:FecR family protein [Blastocatellia bacterium]